MNNIAGNDQGLNSIADIISNFLGILIVLLLIISLAAGAIEKSAAKKNTSDNGSFEFSTSKKEWLPPWSDYYILIDNRIIKWDTEKIVESFNTSDALKADEISVKKDMGTFTLSSIHHQNDIDNYDLEFEINKDWLQKKNTPVTSEKLETFIQKLQSRSIQKKIMPAFYVYPSGMSLFAQICKKMRYFKIPFRWDSVSPGNSCYMYRDRSQFNAEDFYFN